MSVELPSPSVVGAIGLHVSVPTLDMQRALDFYVGMLGLRVAEVGEDLSQLYVGLDRVSLKRVSPSSPSLQIDGTTALHARHFGFRVASRHIVDALEKRLRETDVMIVVPSEDRGSERTLLCCDPSGNQVEIFYEEGDQ